LSINITDDLKVKETATGRYIFGGKVDEISSEYAFKIVTCLSYGRVFDDIRVFPAKTYINYSPEEIVGSLRSQFFSDFTLNYASSGITLTRYEAVGTISENLKILAEFAGFDFWTEVDNLGRKVLYFRPANINLGKTLYLGKVGSNKPNAVRQSHEIDDSMLFNAVEVYGKAKREIENYRWDTLYDHGTFIFVRYPTSVGVTLRGVRLKAGYWSDDYTHDVDNKRVYFHIATGATSTNPATIEIEAEFDETPLAYGEDAGSISVYGKRMAFVIVEKGSVLSDVQTFVSKFLATYSQPRVTLKVLKPGLDFGFKDGGFVRVYDPYLGINGQSFVVRQVRWKYPEGVTELVLSQFEPELYDFQRSVSFKIESSSRSHIQKRDIGIVEKKFYLSDSYGNAALVERNNDIVSHVTTVLLGYSPWWIRLRLRIIGATTVDYNNIYVAPLYLPAEPKNVVRALYMSPYNIGEVAANSSNQITLEAQFYARDIYTSTTETLLAPVEGWRSGASSYFFRTTISGVSKLLSSTIGGVIYLSVDDDYNIYMYWSREHPSHLFGFGFKLV